MDTIIMCAVLRNAAPGILEWIAFHRLVGVDRFVLYDLGSTDGSAALVDRSRFNRQVTMIDWARNGGPATAYRDFIVNHASRFTWAAIIDLDEFVQPLDEDTIRALLPRYDGFSAVSLRRATFGTAGRQMRPGQLVIGSYTNRVPTGSPLNDAAATLLRTSDLRSTDSSEPPHFALAHPICDARGESLPASGLPESASAEVMVVNHYPGHATAEDRATGGPSLFAATASPGAPGNQQLRAAEAQAQATVADRRILRFVPRLRAMLHDASLAAQPRPTPPPPTATPSPPAAPLLLGIGVVTYNRRSVLSETLDRVQQHTKHQRTIVAVADDGSTDGTLDMLRARQVLTVTGRNMSIAWNKNRALFLLSELLRCDVVVLLEDDAYPSRDHWEDEWINAAVRWGHANVAGRWLQEHFISGAGTLDDPIYSQLITAQCAVFSREALLFGGYFDTRFREYGHEHVEHTRRLLRLGYGGSEAPLNGHPGPQFKLLWGGIEFHQVPSVVETKDQQAERNRVLAQALFGDFSYRAAWRNEDEARQLRDEMRHSFPRAVL